MNTEKPEAKSSVAYGAFCVLLGDGEPVIGASSSNFDGEKWAHLISKRSKSCDG
jgi:hypothetical protein